MGAAFDRGLRSRGVLSCAKHFPGHGDAAIDPHLDLPVFAGTMERLNAVELIPFSAAIESGVPLVMTAHILLPQIDAEYPASLSRVMLDGVLRRSGFSGVILADDLGMGAIAKRYGPGEATVKALRAGTDIAMLCHDWSAVEPAIAAVRDGRQNKIFEEEEWRASILRIERLCARADSRESAPSIEILGSLENTRLAEEIRARLKK